MQSSALDPSPISAGGPGNDRRAKRRADLARATRISNRNVKVHAPRGANSLLAPFSISRREPTPDDIQIDILFCGVCHSDMHAVRDEWGGTTGLGSDVKWHVICRELSRVDFWVASRGEAMATE